MDPTTGSLTKYHKVVVHTDQIFHSGDHETGVYNPGVYTIEARGFALSGYDTGVFKELTVTVVDPCPSVTLSIDNAIFKTLPDVSKT